MRKLLLLLLLAVPALAQNGRYDNIAIGPKGVIPFATISVCTQPSDITSAPCTPLANLCSSLTDSTCTSPNPVTADELGNFHWYAKFSTEPYTILIYGPRVAAPYGIKDILLAGGGGGGGVNPGTPFQVTRYDGLGTNIGDSTGSDNPANGPTRWVQGLSVESAFLGVVTPNSPTGTAANLLMCPDLSVTSMTQAVTCPVSTTQAYAVADNGAGTTGNVRGARLGLHQIIFDNQTTANDCAVPSATIAGEATDAGGTCPAGLEQIGRVTTVNTGAGTLATVDLRAWDVVNAAATGSVTTCATANSNAIFAVAGNNVSCDAFVTDDGVGFMTMKGLGLTDTTYAGYYYQTQGPLPPAAPANSILRFPPTSVANAYSMQEPATPGSTGDCYQITGTTTDANGHTIDQMGFAACAGGSAASTRRVCQWGFGDQSGSALLDAQISPQISQRCYIPYAATVVEIMVTADGGTPSIQLAKNHLGTPTNLLSGALATAAAGARACSNTGGTTSLDGSTTCTNTLTTTAIASGDYIEPSGGVAGGTAKAFSVAITFTVN